MWLAWEGPDGYYVGKPNETPTLVAPYYGDGIVRFLNALTALGANDWRFSAGGTPDPVDRVLMEFYGPTGLRVTRENMMEFAAAGGSGTALFFQVAVQNSPLSLNYKHWYTETDDGVGPNTHPVLAPNVILPGVFNDGPLSVTQPFANSELTWAMGNGTLANAAGTVIATSGHPSPWPNYGPSGPGGKEGRVGNAVGLTLFVHDLSPDPTVITTTPYTYDPSTGIVTGGTPFDTPYTHPGGEWTLRRVSYWTSSP
jgi:hypothetical protein